MASLSPSCAASLVAAEAAALALPGLAATVEAIIAAAVTEEWPIVLGLLVNAYNQALSISTSAATALNNAVTCIRAFIASLGGGGTMAACASTHSGKVQGAGLCCAQIGVAGGLVAQPPGTTLPTYTPGQARAGTIPQGRIVQVTDAAGHCASCMIVGSTSKKHPGQPVLKFVRGGPACPTAGTGCCATII